MTAPAPAAKDRRRRKQRRRLARLLRVYPPFLGAGIRPTLVDLEGGRCRVEMKLSWYNRNYVGTQFGGSLYSMCDPFFMLILIEQLGGDYVVWDKAASIRFLKPGRGRVSAEFVVTPEQVAEIRHAADEEGKVERAFVVHVVDDAGETVARVEKLLYVRRK